MHGTFSFSLAITPTLQRTVVLSAQRLTTGHRPTDNATVTKNKVKYQLFAKGHAIDAHNPREVFPKKSLLSIFNNNIKTWVNNYVVPIKSVPVNDSSVSGNNWLKGKFKNSQIFGGRKLKKLIFINVFVTKNGTIL